MGSEGGWQFVLGMDSRRQEVLSGVLLCLWVTVASKDLVPVFSGIFVGQS